MFLAGATIRRGTRAGDRGARNTGWFEFDDRVRSVLDAIRAAPKYLPAKLVDATGYELGQIASGIVPGLLLLLGVIALGTTVGAAAGAALGALAGGVGAVPGAVIGAGAGFNVSLAILNFLGLAFLAAYIGDSLIDAGKVASEAVAMAWGAIDHPHSKELVVESAAARMANAVALVFRGVLQGLVAYLLAKGTAAVASRVPELVAQLRTSKLGAGFAEWVSKNWEGLTSNRKLQPPSSTFRELPATGGKSTTAPPSSGQRVSTPALGSGSKTPTVPASEVNAYKIPLGAVKGTAKPGLPAEPLTKAGWPDLPATEAPNFNSIEPVTLRPGTKLCRVIDDSSNPAGKYWSEKLPSNEAQWRSELAVKPEWNSDGKYVEYTVPDGPGLKVWKGETAAQQLQGTDHYLPGGGAQIWMPPNTVTPGAALPTGW